MHWGVKTYSKRSYLNVLFSAIFVLSFLSGCSGSKYFRVPDPLPSDMKPVPEPKYQHINIAADVFDKQIIVQTEESFDLSRQIRNISGTKKEAVNVNGFDEFDNSSWFTNRNFMKRMSPAEIARGPNQGLAPDTTGPWIIIGAKTEGVTPGFSVKDNNGTRFLLKFDPPGYSEMATGAEVVSTKLFHAAGYNVPQNYIVYFDPSILEIGENVTFRDAKGHARAMTESDLKEILARIEFQPDGHIRAVASKFIKGKLKGPFRYNGVRDDDFNDFVPHQHRRELRGLRVIASWLNHFDTKDNNSLDVYVEEGYIKHYLIDFGSTLGSNGDEPMPAFIGHENSFDPHEIGLNFISLGWRIPPYQKNWHVKYPSIGYFESSLFDPPQYKFILANPAFELMTDRDGYWGAKIVMSFTDEQIKAAIAEGQYSNPDAADYLFQVIKERRDKIGQYWFQKMNPLDKFELRETEYGTQNLCFTDLAVACGFELPELRGYRYWLLHNGDVIPPVHELEGVTCLQLTEITAPSVRESRNTSGKNQWAIAIETKLAENEWSNKVRVYLTYDWETGKHQILGVEREE
jgi:hypothetical protein